MLRRATAAAHIPQLLSKSGHGLLSARRVPLFLLLFLLVRPLILLQPFRLFIDHAQLLQLPVMIAIVIVAIVVIVVLHRGHRLVLEQQRAGREEGFGLLRRRSIVIIITTSSAYLFSVHLLLADLLVRGGGVFHLALDAIFLLVNAVITLTDLLKMDNRADIAARAAATEVQRHFAQLMIVLIIMP